MMKHIFLWVKKLILDLLFPTFCVKCRQEGFFLCGLCKATVQWVPPTCIVCGAYAPKGIRTPAGRTCPHCREKSDIYAFLSPFLYSSPLIRDLIHQLKYGRARSIGPILGTFLVDYIGQQGISFPSPLVCIPVPLHKARERERGFNQSERIARYVAKKCSLPLDVRALKRIKKTQPQITLSAEERRQNVKDIFRVDEACGSIKDKTILLVDDIKTTGATLEEAARVLKNAGAKQVWAMTVAH